MILTVLPVRTIPTEVCMRFRDSSPFPTILLLTTFSCIPSSFAGPGKRIDIKTKKLVVQMQHNGTSFTNISRQIGISRKSVRRIVSNYRAYGMLEKKRGRSRLGNCLHFTRHINHTSSFGWCLTCFPLSLFSPLAFLDLLQNLEFRKVCETLYLDCIRKAEAIRK